MPRLSIPSANGQTIQLPSQGRRSSTAKLAPLLDGIRGLMETVLSESSTSPSKPLIEQGVSDADFDRAASTPTSNGISGARQQCVSLAAATRYSDTPQSNPYPSEQSPISHPYPASMPEGNFMAHPTQGATSDRKRGSIRAIAEALPYEPIKWQLPELRSHQDGASQLKPKISRAVEPQQLSWTARTSPAQSSITAKPAAKQTAAAGEKRAPRLNESRIKQQENIIELQAHPLKGTIREAGAQGVIPMDQASPPVSADSDSTQESMKNPQRCVHDVVAFVAGA